MKAAFFLVCVLLFSPQLSRADDFDAFNWDGWLFGGPSQPVPPGITLKSLVTITSDKNNNKDYLSLMVNPSFEITGMYSMPDPKNEKNENGSGRSIYPLGEIESAKGSVMLTARGRDIMLMKGTLNRKTLEGRFAIRYLTNGIFMNYESCELLLKREKENWYVENAYNGKRVQVIKVHTHSLGISDLEGICPERAL